MSISRVHRFQVFMVVIATVGYSPAQTTTPATIKSLPDMTSAPHFEVDKLAAAWAASLVTAHSKQGAAMTLVAYASVNPLTVDQLYSIRKVGTELQPEFGSAVLDTLQSNNEPFARGRLLNLLRDATPKDTSVIAKLLSDVRPAEELSKLATADGATPFRVCDVAYNVLQEVRAADKSTTKLLVRSSSIEERDELVAPVREQTPQPDPNPKPPAPLPPTPSTPVPTATPAPSAPAPLVVESPAPVVEHKPPVWPWLVGIVALTVIALLVWKRRT